MADRIITNDSNNSATGMMVGILLVVMVLLLLYLFGFGGLNNFGIPGTANQNETNVQVPDNPAEGRGGIDVDVPEDINVDVNGNQEQPQQ